MSCLRLNVILWGKWDHHNENISQWAYFSHAELMSYGFSWNQNELRKSKWLQFLSQFIAVVPYDKNMKCLFKNLLISLSPHDLNWNFILLDIEYFRMKNNKDASWKLRDKWIGDNPEDRSIAVGSIFYPILLTHLSKSFPHLASNAIFDD